MKGSQLGLFVSRPWTIILSPRENEDWQHQEERIHYPDVDSWPETFLELWCWSWMMEASRCPLPYCPSLPTHYLLVQYSLSSPWTTIITPTHLTSMAFCANIFFMESQEIKSMLFVGNEDNRRTNISVRTTEKRESQDWIRKTSRAVSPQPLLCSWHAMWKYFDGAWWSVHASLIHQKLYPSNTLQ